MAAKYTDEVLRQVQAAVEQAVYKSYKPTEAEYQEAAAASAAAQAAKQAGLAGAVTKKQQKEFYQPIKVSASGISESKYSNPQTAREEQLALKKAPETKKQTRDRTKKEYNDYVKSDEYKKRVTENDQKARAEAAAQMFLNPGQPMPQPKVIQDEREMQLRAAMETAEQEYNTAEDDKVIAEDLEAITGLSNEERRELEQYAVNQIRDQNLPVEMVGVMPTAQQEASGLIDKYGKQRVDELAETFMRQENADMARKVDEKTREFVNKRGLSDNLADIATIPAAAISGLVGTVGQLQGMARNTGRYKTLDPYATGTIGDTFVGAARGQHAQNLVDDFGGGFLGKAASVGYQGIMSAADSIARAFLGGGAVGGAALAATGSFSQTMAEASRQGASPAQAALLATVNSGIEALSEKIPLDNLIRTAKGTGAKTVLLNALRQMGIEATTEEISLLGTVLAEAAILQEKSAYKQDIIAGITSGMSADDAIIEANKKILGEALNTLLVSAVSGGASSLSGSYADARGLFAQEQEQNNPALNQPKQSDVVKSVEDLWQKYGQPEAQQAAEQPQQAAAPAVETQTTQPVEQAPQATQQPQAAPKSKQSTVIDSVVETIQRNGGNVTNRMAETVLNDAAAKQQLSEQIGMEISGSKSQQRKIVKDALSQMAASQDTQTETAQNPPTAEPMQATETSEQATKQASAPTTDMQMGASTQSAKGVQIRGTGAAEQNFSGKPSYNATLSEDNAQPDRRNDVRPMELPATDVNGGNISATTANVYGSQNTPDDLAAAMEEPVARGDFSYVRITNDEATQRAQETIGNAGNWETARDNFRMDVDRGNAGAELSARGALILNHAAEVYQQAKDSGDAQAAERAKREWLTILSDVQKLGTNTAQGLQALKIIRNLMPKDKIQFTRIAVQNMVRDMRLNTDIQIDEQLLTDYENATTDQQRDEIMEKIQQNVADQIPTTWLDKWNALRYTNMLGNLKTNVRNFAGNVANTFIYRFKDGTGAVIEAIANKATGGKTGRTKSVIVDKRIEKACADYYQQVKNAINDGGKYSENTASGDFSQGVMDKRQIFKFKPLEGYRKTTNWMMNNQYFGDEAFGKASFTHAMAGYLHANGVKNAADIQKASPDLIDNAVAYAVKEAQETTFKDNTALANVLGKIKKDAGIVGEGLMPFTKTPANVLTRAEEYSPLGILNTAIMGAQKLAGNTKLADANGKIGTWAQNGQDITGTDIINSLSKSLTGSAIFALGAILKSQGILNGGPDDDEEQAAFDKMNGIQPYSINMPDGTTYTLDWLTPVAMPLFMGAQLMQIASEKDLTFADLEQVLTSIADPMIQMSMMQGINSSLEDIKYSGNNMGQFFMNAAVNYLTQGLTNTLLGQIERSTEENRQTTYINPDSQTPQWMQKALGKASQKVPGWDYQQTDYVDAWGQKQKNEGGLLYNLLSPGYSSEKKSDAVTQELNRLRKATGEKVFPDTASKTISYIDKDGFSHDDVRLTEDQYQTLAETQGQTARKLVEDMVKSKAYQALTDEQKSEALDEAYLYARKTGEIAAIGESHTGYDQSWMYDVNKGGGANELMRRVFNSSLNTSMSDLDNAWEKGYNEETFSRDMEEAYDSYKKAPASMRDDIYAEATGTAKRYMEARDKGLTHKEVISAIENVVKVHGTGAVNKETGKPTVRDIDRRKAIASTPGLSESAKDILMKAYMADYDPSDERPETTEFKYDYARKEMGLSATEYADTYKAYLDSDKKREKVAAIRALGYDYGTALALYNLYNGRKKKKLIKLYG